MTHMIKLEKKSHISSHDLRLANHSAVRSGIRDVVFIHGFGTDGGVWSSFQKALAGTCRTSAVDLAGCSARSMESFSSLRYTSLYPFAEDILLHCAQQRLVRPLLVGHSVGGMISLLAARLQPESVSGVAAICASPRYLNDVGYYGGFDHADVEGLLTRMSENFSLWASGFAPCAMGNPDRPELGMYFAEKLGAMRPDVAAHIARLAFTSDHRKDLSHIDVPVHVIQSRDDLAVPVSVARYLASHLPNGTLSLIDASGHLPHVSAADLVRDEILGILASR